MSQLRRHQFYHFINIAAKAGETENPKWAREGKGVEALAVEFNPQTTQFKDITSEQADTTFDGYQISSSVSDKRCYTDDPMYEYLYELKKEATSAETQLVEVNSAKKVTGATESAGYDATKYDVMIVINSWLGENAYISYDIYYKNPVQGVATIADGTLGTFTESV